MEERVYRAMVLMGSRKKAITGMIQYCGPSQPPDGSHWRITAKTTSSAMPTTKLGNTVPPTAKVVVT